MWVFSWPFSTRETYCGFYARKFQVRCSWAVRKLIFWIRTRSLTSHLCHCREGVTAVEEPTNCPNVSRIACNYASVFQEFLRDSALPIWNRFNNTGFWRQLTVSFISFLDPVILFLLDPCFECTEINHYMWTFVCKLDYVYLVNRFGKARIHRKMLSYRFRIPRLVFQRSCLLFRFNLISLFGVLSWYICWTDPIEWGKESEKIIDDLLVLTFST